MKLVIFCSRCCGCLVQIPWDPFYCPTAATGAVANGSHLQLYPERALGRQSCQVAFIPHPTTRWGGRKAMADCYGIHKPSLLASRQADSQCCNVYFPALHGVRQTVTPPETTFLFGFSSAQSCSPPSLRRFSCEHLSNKEIGQEPPFFGSASEEPDLRQPHSTHFSILWPPEAPFLCIQLEKLSV